MKFYFKFTLVSNQHLKKAINWVLHLNGQAKLPAFIGIVLPIYLLYL